MKKTKFWMLSWAILLAAAVGFTACVDDDEDTEMPYLEVTPAALTFGEDGAALNGNTINITTNRAWNITLLAADGDTVDPAEWITLSKYEGGGMLLSLLMFRQVPLRQLLPKLPFPIRPVR